MKKLILTIVMAATILSCTTEDYCGIVTGIETPRPNVYRVQLDNGDYHRVTFDVYLSVRLEEYTCIY